MNLTPRERVVARHILSAYSKGNIAAILGVSYETVRAHGKAILRKSGTHTFTQFAMSVINSEAMLREVMEVA